LLGFDVKIIFAILSALFSIGAYFPYLKDMLAGKTKPHVYTWLIWTLTTSTATAGLWHGGGGYAAVSQTIATILTFIFFLLSFKYGTKNITLGDTILLLLASAAIFVWWFLHNPLLAVLMVAAIDAIGYIPTFRKSFEEPWSESILSWVLFNLGIAFSLLALAQYNLLTLPVLLMSFVANSILIAICFFRRAAVETPIT
jgi:hypothetical protein